MIVLIAGLVIFLGIHLVRILAPGWRDARVEQFGLKKWKGIYTLVSFVGLGLMVWGFSLANADAADVFDPPEWGRSANFILMFIALILMLAGDLPRGYLRTWLHHPFMIASLIWSAGHLLANGDLASVLLFGSFLVWSVLYLFAVSRRPKEAAPEVMPSVKFDAIAVAGGSALYALFVWAAHGWLFGVPLT